MIELNHVEHRYKSGFTFAPLSWKVSVGECVAVFGRNGAGKSTLFQLLTGFLPTQKGTIKINQQIMAPRNPELRKNIGYLTQKLPLPEWSSPLQLLQYAADLHGVHKDQIQNTLSQWDCKPFADKPIRSFSHGMKKRVGLCLATLHQPDLLILDEPYSGLDIAQNENLSVYIKNSTKTILLSTHIVPYAATLCGRAIFVDSGRVEELQGWSKLGHGERVALVQEKIGVL